MAFAPNGSLKLLGQVVSISGDGNSVIFQSEASNLVFGDTNQVIDVFVVSALGGGGV